MDYLLNFITSRKKGLFYPSFFLVTFLFILILIAEISGSLPKDLQWIAEHGFAISLIISMLATLLLIQRSYTCPPEEIIRHAAKVGLLTLLFIIGLYVVARVGQPVMKTIRPGSPPVSENINLVDLLSRLDATDQQIEELKLSISDSNMTERQLENFIKEFESREYYTLEEISDYLIKELGVVTFPMLTQIAATEGVQATATAYASICYITPKANIWVRQFPSKGSVAYGALSSNRSYQVLGRSGPLLDSDTWWYVTLQQQNRPVEGWRWYYGYENIEGGWISGTVITLMDDSICSRLPILVGSGNP